MANQKKKINITHKTTSRLSKSEKLADLSKPSASSPSDVPTPKQDVNILSEKAGSPPSSSQPQPSLSPGAPTPSSSSNRVPDGPLTPEQPSIISDSPQRPPSTDKPIGSGAEGAIDDQLSDISPSIKKGDQKQEPGNKAVDKTKDKVKDAAKDKAKDVGKKAGEQVAEKGARQLALAALRAVGTAISSAASAVAAAVGWPWLVGCLVVFLIVILIFGGLGCLAINGYFGGVLPKPAGKDNPHVKALVAAQKKDDGNIHLFDLPNKRDQEFLESGKIDERLAAALDYLVQKHEYVRVSHIVSGYEDTNINPESGAFSDSQITKNISAHRRGQAADIDAIDYVKEKCDCGDEIPVLASWQTIGENPYGNVPDVLNQIDSPDDIISPEVRAALEILGVEGLDQDKLVERMMTISVLANIKSVYDLADPNVITAFAEIGVTGLDNKDFQTGLKRAKALQQLYDLNPTDISSLEDENVQKLLNDAGVPVGSDAISAIKKYQATQILSTITSAADFQKPEVIAALAVLEVDTTDPKFIDSINKMAAADTIINWKGDLSDEKLQQALALFDITYGSDFVVAMDTFSAAKKLYESPEMTTDAVVIALRDSASVQTDSPEAQKVIQMFKSGYNVLKTDSDPNNPEYWQALENFGVDIQGGNDPKKARENAVNIVNKYKSANFLLDYHGDFSDPEFLASLDAFGIKISSDDQKEAVAKYKAANTLSRASKGEIAKDSQEVKDALKIIGSNSIDDEKGQAAVRVGESDDVNSPATQEDKEILGMNKTELQSTLGQVGAAKNLLNIKDFGDLTGEKAQENLKTLKLDSPDLLSIIETIGSVQQIINIKPSDIRDAGEQAAMTYLSINDPKLYTTMGKLGDLQRLLKIDNLTDLKGEDNQNALRNLGVKDAKVYEYIGKIGSIQTLYKIQNLTDFTKPEVIEALGDLKIANTETQKQLSDAGAIYSLTQIKEPSDLLQPQNLKALDQLNVINLDAEFLGQISAVQTLLKVDSVTDLLNPNSILALNTLGLVSLSNPITTALMVISFLDNILGGKLLGGIFGKDCKASTDCYKPTAQANVHTTIGELLQFPYDEGNPDYYKITQLITYSEERDVLPFAVQLNSLYGADRPHNFGLFAMQEANDHIHIGY